MIVADAGPLLGLERIELVSILADLYGTVLIPPRVPAELELSQGRPGSHRLAAALQEGWLRVEAPNRPDELKRLRLLLDGGEAEAILLAEDHPGEPLLLDERRGRTVARSRQIPVIGTGGVLLLAKRYGHIERVVPVLDRLAEAGYRLSPALRHHIGVLPGEGDSGG